MYHRFHPLIYKRIEITIMGEKRQRMAYIIISNANIYRGRKGAHVDTEDRSDPP